MSLESQIANLAGRVRRLEQDALGADAISIPATSSALTLTAEHNMQILQSMSATAVTITCPGGTVTGAGFTCEIWQVGTGQITIIGGPGVVIHQADSLVKTRKVSSVVSIRYLTNTDVYIAGDLV